MRQQFFLKDETVVLKGAMAVLILIHHLYQNTLIGGSSLFVDYFFRSLGYIGVSGFFFFSGYGMTISNILSDGLYFENFFKRRLLPIYLINVSLVLIYFIAFILFSVDVSFRDVIQSLTFGGTIIPNGWYLQELILFYLLYCFSWKCDKKRSVIITSVCVLFTIFVFIYLKMGSHWFLSPIGFIVGLWMAKLKDNEVFIKIMNNCIMFRVISLSTLVISISSFILCFFLQIHSLSLFTKVFIIAPSVPLVLFILSTRIRYSNSCLQLIGSYALEVYVMQGLAILLLRNNYWQANTLVFLMSIIPILSILVYISHPLFTAIMGYCRRN